MIHRSTNTLMLEEKKRQEETTQKLNQARHFHKGKIFTKSTSFPD
jgi:hypothetical protein